MSDQNNTTLRLAGENAPLDFLIDSEASLRKSVAQALGIDGVRKLRFEGKVSPDGASDWQLNARLGATVIQSCVVTFVPVTTRIDTDVVRRFVKELPDIGTASEVEMPEDDSLEPLSETIDLTAIMTEELALALPDFPRADGVSPVDVSVTEPGKTPMTDDDAKPFAGLASLRDSLKSSDENED